MAINKASGADCIGNPSKLKKKHIKQGEMLNEKFRSFPDLSTPVKTAYDKTFKKGQFNKKGLGNLFGYAQSDYEKETNIFGKDFVENHPQYKKFDVNGDGYDLAEHMALIIFESAPAKYLDGFEENPKLDIKNDNYASRAEINTAMTEGKADHIKEIINEYNLREAVNDSQ